MGAQEFVTTADGKTAQEAFTNAVKEAQYENGHGGYTGTIAEKNSFKTISCELDIAKGEALMDKCLADMDHWCQDKWGPAAAIQLSKELWVFFGWASS